MDIVIGIIFISLIGTLLHFMYEWSGHNKVVSLFAAVNESTWEHIKIALTPTFIWTLYDGAVYGLNQNYFIAKTASLLVIILLIPLLFYTYQIFTKKSVLWIDIIIFYLAIISSTLIFKYLINITTLPFYLTYISVIVLFIIFGFYMVLTLLPIKNFLFKDPITNKYGIKGHSHHGHKEKNNKNVF